MSQIGRQERVFPLEAWPVANMNHQQSANNQLQARAAQPLLRSAKRQPRMRITIKVCFLIALGWLLGPSPAPAQELVHLGDFHNVLSRDDGEHCSGYSLSLWRHGGRVIGLLDVHSGLCGDPRCAVIEKVKFDSKTGQLAFASSVSSLAMRFVGTIRAKSVVGTINGEAVELKREENSGDTFESLKAWCSFWAGVPRCSGVKALCQSFAAGARGGGISTAR